MAALTRQNPFKIMILSPKILALIHAENPADTRIELISDEEAAILVSSYFSGLPPEEPGAVTTADAIVHWAQLTRLNEILLDLTLRGWIDVGWSHEKQEVTFRLSEAGRAHYHTLNKAAN